MECNGQSVPRTDYPLLFDFFNTQTQVVGSETKSLLDIYGYVDSDHFNLPDYQEVALVGAGTNLIDKASGALATSDIYTVGEFKDDRVQNHTHAIKEYGTGSYLATSQLGGGNIWSATVNPSSSSFSASNITEGRHGGTTRMKSKGVKFIIKVL